MGKKKSATKPEKIEKARTAGKHQAEYGDSATFADEPVPASWAEKGFKRIDAGPLTDAGKKKKKFA